MPELLIELFSEEIPARMQVQAAANLSRLMREMLGREGFIPKNAEATCGPRRIVYRTELPPQTFGKTEERRGPRADGPVEARRAFVGSLLPRDPGYPDRADEVLKRLEMDGRWISNDPTNLTFVIRPAGKAHHIFMERTFRGEPTAAVVDRWMPSLLRDFPWPKSMRWGTSDFAWVRPLQRILCVFDGRPVHFELKQGADCVHDLAAADLTEGHRVLAGTEPFAVRDFASYERGLRERFVIVDAAERERIIEKGIHRLAAAEGLEVVPDRGLLAEVAGLVEWPAPLLGRIDDAFMDLPPEVMRTTMRVNQRYFSLCHPGGRAAPRFAIVSNIVPQDGGAAIVAGNERVLRARLSDARFFWDQDLRQPLEDFLPKLETVVFHAKLGTQGERVRRLERLSALIAPMVGADPERAARAAKLAKADLASGMVGEFPELQGVMGRYYARHAGEDPRVAEAIGAQYRPLGPGDTVPDEPVAMAVALADKLDQLAGFFAVDERPTGSGDPYALRRAALGVVRILRENRLRLGLTEALVQADDLAREVIREVRRQRHSGSDELYQEAEAVTDSGHCTPSGRMINSTVWDVFEFLVERLRVQLRTEGARHDIVAAVFGAAPDDDLIRLLARSDALGTMLATPDGANLLAAYRRAANILRIETRKDGPHDGPVDPALLAAGPERTLAEAVAAAREAVTAALAREDFLDAMERLAALRPPLDAFFEAVVVNDTDPQLRRNRLRLLNALCGVMDAVADVSKIEG